MAAHKVLEVGVADGVDGARPDPGKAVRYIGQKAMNRITSGDGALLRAKDEDVSRGMGMPVKIQVQIKRRIPKQVGRIEGDGRQLQCVVFELGLVCLHLRDLVRAE